MINKRNSYSISFWDALPEVFDFNPDTIKNILLNGHKNLMSNKKLSKEIKRYSKLNFFLGKKRKPSGSLTIEEIKKIKSNLNNIEPKKIDFSERIGNTFFQIDIECENNYVTTIFLFKKPFLIYQIFDNITKMDIDFIADNVAFTDKIRDLSEYEFDLYYIFNKKLEKINSLVGLNELSNNSCDHIMLDVGTIDDIKTNEKKIDSNYNLKISPFLLVIKSSLPKINESDLEYKNIYHYINNNLDLISANLISIKYFYYFTINKSLQDKYNFILTSTRKKFIKFLDNFIIALDDKNIMVIGGPKGVGKTSSLIFFSCLKQNRVFYINLEASYRNKNNLKEKDLLIELSKLYGPYENNDGGKSKNEIKEYIKKYYAQIDILELLLNIINIFIKSKNEFEPLIFCFVIDQISFTDNHLNLNDNLLKIMEVISKTPYLRLILCITLNNENAKIFLKNSFDNNNIIYNFYYFQNFFTSQDINDNILKEENINIQNTINELGNFPGHFYEIKREKNTDNYIEYLEKNIQNNLNVYYKNKNISKQLELLDLVYGQKVVCSSFLKEKIEDIPLKYLIIKKFKISKDLIQRYLNIYKDDDNEIFIDYLKNLLYNYENKVYDQIFKKYYDFLEYDSEDFIDEFLEKDNESRNIFGNFYKDYIEKYIS